MDITGASDPYVKIKLFDNKVSFKIMEHVASEQEIRFLIPTRSTLFHSSYDSGSYFLGKKNWKEKEDEREILQFESVLERIFRLPYWWNGHETRLYWCYGNCHAYHQLINRIQIFYSIPSNFIMLKIFFKGMRLRFNWKRRSYRKNYAWMEPI